jgi:ketosteroid isomerase-like protein
MATNAERQRTALESGDLEQLVALLDDRVVWRGLPGWDYGHRAEPDVAADDNQEHDDHAADHEHEGDDHERVPLCPSREEVRAVLEGFLAAGSGGQPVVVASAGDSLVVDPRAEPALPFQLHLAFTFRGGRIVLIQDYPNRAAAIVDLSP